MCPVPKQIFFAEEAAICYITALEKTLYSAKRITFLKWKYSENVLCTAHLLVTTPKASG